MFNISVVYVTTTEMQLQWQSTDVASEYVYLLDIVPKHSSDQVNSSHREITLQDLGDTAALPMSVPIY